MDPTASCDCIAERQVSKLLTGVGWSGSSTDRCSILPSIWAADGIFDSYLAPSFEALKSSYAVPAQAGEGVVQILG